MLTSRWSLFLFFWVILSSPLQALSWETVCAGLILGVPVASLTEKELLASYPFFLERFDALSVDNVAPVRNLQKELRQALTNAQAEQRSSLTVSNWVWSFISSEPARLTENLGKRIADLEKKLNLVDAVIKASDRLSNPVQVARIDALLGAFFAEQRRLEFLGETHAWMLVKEDETISRLLQLHKADWQASGTEILEIQGWIEASHRFCDYLEKGEVAHNPLLSVFLEEAAQFQIDSLGPAEPLDLRFLALSLAIQSESKPGDVFTLLRDVQDKLRAEGVELDRVALGFLARSRRPTAERLVESVKKMREGLRAAGWNDVSGRDLALLCVLERGSEKDVGDYVAELENIRAMYSRIAPDLHLRGMALLARAKERLRLDDQALAKKYLKVRQWNPTLPPDWIGMAITEIIATQGFEKFDAFRTALGAEVESEWGMVAVMEVFGSVSRRRLPLEKVAEWYHAFSRLNESRLGGSHFRALMEWALAQRKNQQLPLDRLSEREMRDALAVPALRVPSFADILREPNQAQWLQSSSF